MITLFFSFMAEQFSIACVYYNFLCIHRLVNICIVFLWVFWKRLLLIFVYKFLHGHIFLFVWYFPWSGIEKTYDINNFISNIWGIARLSNSDCSIYIPASNIQYTLYIEYIVPIFHIIANTYFLIFNTIKACLGNVKLYLAVTIFCVSLMNSDVECIFLFGEISSKSFAFLKLGTCHCCWAVFPTYWLSFHVFHYAFDT